MDNDTENDSIIEWSESDESILQSFCIDNEDLKNLFDSPDSSWDKIIEVSEKLDGTYLLSDIQAKILEFLGKEKTINTALNSVWTQEDETTLKEFCTQHPLINKNNERGKKGRIKLMTELNSQLGNRYTDEDVQLKILDVLGKWRSEDVDMIISFYQKHSYLWDTALLEYRNKGRKNVALEELSKQIDFRKTAQEIHTKFEGLKTTFASHCKQGKTGDGGRPMTPWPYFNSLLFLKKTCTQRPSYTNATNTKEDAVCSQTTSTKESGVSNLPTSSGVPNLVANKRKHISYGMTNDDYIKKKIVDCLEQPETAADSFGKHLAQVLKLFTPINQEFVKARLQHVISECLQKQELNLPIPNFSSDA